MPTYQYACTECGEQLEAVQSFSDPALTVCPNCQGKLRKVFNSVGIVFKGSGFYRNDSRNGATKADKADAASTSDSSSSTKADSAVGAAAESDSSSSSSGSAAASTSSSSSSSSGSATKAGATSA